MNKIKIVFMGTPEFALPVLSALADKYEVILCVTKPDAPKGRGNVMTESPVKTKAKELGIPVICPEKVKTEEFFEFLKVYEADFFVTCAYGKILPESILKLPKYGCINVHASLLPKYRGAAPLWRVVLNGEKETGVTTMLTDAGMDTGDMLLAKKIEIGENMTTGDVHDALAPLGAEIIIETIEGILAGTITPQKQNNDEATYAPMVSREDGELDFSKSAQEVHNIVRGCNPFPGAYATLESGEKIKIWQTTLAEITPEQEYLPTGTIISENKGEILVKCADKAVKLEILQRNGAKKMSAKDFLNGKSLGERFLN